MISKRIRMRNKQEILERNLSTIDLSLIEKEINLEKKIRFANVIAQTLFALLLGSVVATVYFQLLLLHII